LIIIKKIIFIAETDFVKSAPAVRVGRVVAELPVVRADAVEGVGAEGLEGGGQEEQRSVHARSEHSGEKKKTFWTSGTMDRMSKVFKRSSRHIYIF
jgi:hypothetical protein